MAPQTEVQKEVETDANSSANSTKNRKGKKRARGYEGDEVFKASRDILCPTRDDGEVVLVAVDGQYNTIIQRRESEIGDLSHTTLTGELCTVAICSVTCWPDTNGCIYITSSHSAQPALFRSSFARQIIRLATTCLRHFCKWHNQ